MARSKMQYLRHSLYLSFNKRKISPKKINLSHSYERVMPGPDYLDSIKIFICLVYFFAGIAKINSDWLLNAQPLSIWLPSKYDLPILGGFFFEQSWVHYLMSWGGMLYDISIPFLLISSLDKKISPLL